MLGGLTAGLGQANHATIVATGKANTANQQTFNGTHIDIYAAVIEATNGTGTGTMTMNLGALTHTPGGSLLIPTQSGIVNTTTSVAGTNGILGGWAIAGNSSTSDGIRRGTDYATVDGSGKIVPYTGYVAVPVESVGTIRAGRHHRRQRPQEPEVHRRRVGRDAHDAEGAGTTTDINTFAYDTGAFNHTLVIGQGNTLRFGVNGGIFKTSTQNNQVLIGGTGGQLAASLGANAGNITAGGPNPNTPGELVVTLNGTNNNNGGATIASNIVDNGTGPHPGQERHDLAEDQRA